MNVEGYKLVLPMSDYKLLQGCCFRTGINVSCNIFLKVYDIKFNRWHINYQISANVLYRLYLIVTMIVGFGELLGCRHRIIIWRETSQQLTRV